jgi:hypothetical protein
VPSVKGSFWGSSSVAQKQNSQNQSTLQSEERILRKQIRILGTKGSWEREKRGGRERGLCQMKGCETWGVRAREKFLGQLMLRDLNIDTSNVHFSVLGHSSL